ncbi:MAG: hypothetical protein ACJ790_17400 [Myxococcaceae bacterium]
MRELPPARRRLRNVPLIIWVGQLGLFIVFALFLAGATHGWGNTDTFLYWLLIFGAATALFVPLFYSAWSRYVVRPRALTGALVLVSVPLGVFCELLACGALADFLRDEGILLVGAVGAILGAIELVAAIGLLIAGAMLAKKFPASVTPEPSPLPAPSSP